MNDDDDETLTAEGAARRRFLYGTGALTTGLATSLAPVAAIAATPHEAAARTPGAPMPVRLNVNGHDYDLMLEPRVTLLDALREYIGLDRHEERLRPRPVRRVHGACQRPAHQCVPGTRRRAHGRSHRTIEGLAEGAALHPVQAAFIEHDGFQCGYCTPGQICSAVAMLAEVRAGTVSAATADVRRTLPVDLTDAEIRERMSGNLCRCGAYVGIVAAVRDASTRA